MGRKVVFWGAGEAGRLAMGNAVVRHIAVECFVDTNSSKWGTEYKGLTVYPPEHLLHFSEDIEVIVTVGKNYQNDVITRLSDMGFVYGKNVFTYHDKFSGGGIPGFSEPGFIDLNDGFSLVKPITDSFLVFDEPSNTLYRALGGEKLEYFRTVHERINCSERLLECIVNTTITEHEYLNTLSPLVLRHEYINPISYSLEWPPAMFRDYILFMVNFIADLDKAGLGLGDPSGNNTTFYKGKFLYLDYSGIHWAKTSLRTMRLFIELHINILVLMVKNREKAYMFLRNRGFLAKYEDISGYLTAAEREDYQEALNNCLNLVEKKRVSESCLVLEDYVHKITDGMVSTSDWTGYQDSLYQSTHTPALWTSKQRNVMDLINQAGPKTMLDLAGNMGWYCIAKAKDLEYAIVADVDMGIVDKAYEIIKQSNVSNIFPVWLNLISPTPAYYRGHHIISTGAIHAHIKSAVDRFRCDLVLALAVEHHLALSQGLSFDEIIKQLSLYTNRHLLIEFVDRDDPYVIQYLKLNDDFRTAWYTRERFEAALGKIFTIIASPSERKARTLYLCEKK